MDTLWVDNRKNVGKTMAKTFTFLFLLCASVIFLPQQSKAAASAPSYADAKYGEKELIKFYPNPMVADANIKISEDVDLYSSKVSVVFYNIVGSEIYKIAQIKDYEQKITHDVFKNSGIYFYQLIVDEKIIATGRITVK